jgi:hypothetical protein
MMRWLAFIIMILYTVRKLIVDGPQGKPPNSNSAGKNFYYNFYLNAKFFFNNDFKIFYLFSLNVFTKMVKLIMY